MDAFITMILSCLVVLIGIVLAAKVAAALLPSIIMVWFVVLILRGMLRTLLS